MGKELFERKKISSTTTTTIINSQQRTRSNESDKESSRKREKAENSELKKGSLKIPNDLLLIHIVDKICCRLYFHMALLLFFYACFSLLFLSLIFIFFVPACASMFVYSLVLVGIRYTVIYEFYYVE